MKIRYNCEQIDNIVYTIQLNMQKATSSYSSKNDLCAQLLKKVCRVYEYTMTLTLSCFVYFNEVIALS